MGNICPQNKNAHHGRASYLERHESGFKGYNNSGSAGNAYPVQLGGGANTAQSYREVNNGMIIINGHNPGPITHINSNINFFR